MADTYAASKSLVAQSEAYLKVKASGGTDITESTAVAIVQYLEQKQRQNPDLAKSAPFSPYALDDRAMRFLMEMIKRDAKTAGLDDIGISKTIKEAWAGNDTSARAQNFGFSAAIYSLLNYANHGKLPGGETALKPQVDSKWNNTKIPGLFFNPEVYKELKISLDQKYFVESGSVSHATLFYPPNADPAQQKLIEEAAKKIKMMPINPEEKDPQNYRYSHQNIAELAREIMIMQAKTICSIQNEKDITKAIMTHQYMPHLSDMKLVEQSFGKPKEWPAALLAQLRETKVIPEGIGQPDARYDIYRSGLIAEYQGQEWAKRFGKIDPEDALKIGMLRLRVTDPNKVLRTQEGEHQTVREWSEKTQHSPFSFYGPPFNRERAVAYNDIRENTYGPRIRFMATYEGLDPCSINPTPHQRPLPGAGTTDTTTAPPPPPAAKPPAATPPAAAPAAAPASAPPPPPPAAPAANDKICRADAAAAFGCGNPLKENTQDTTGQRTIAPPAACRADSDLTCAPEKPVALPVI